MTTRYRLPGMAALPAQPRPRGGARPYARGSAAERELLASYRADGLLAVRSASSHGAFDVYALRPGGGDAVQVKCCTVAPTPGQIARWLAALPEVPQGWVGKLAVRVGGAWTFHTKGPDMVHYQPDSEEA